ncbi:hypothetical protein MC7420_324 [Coleofasciculus chthonoplastes PCC 7420]|uniref:Uncharacterized protein n=1 Tax=Coleofasciculus chthonoplastes PCC 7420 TaxID=118168 RepID=B4VL42_9CYAN|nr:hypothetical protein [Coleofasciculus chthonoplastes]EDX77187.1 hypothetical protein MC7420_324 [Coleofasciculus chthonoplastes PCC 7420]
MNPTLNKFRVSYPQGSLISDLLAIDHGQYIVRVSVEIDGVTRSTGLAAAQTVELAEDQARQRAITVLAVDRESSTDTEISPPHRHTQTSVAAAEVPSSPESIPNSAPAFAAKRMVSTPEVEDTPSPTPIDTHPISAKPSPPPEPTEPLPETVEPSSPSKTKPSPPPEPTVTLPETVEPPSLTEDISGSETPLFKEETPSPVGVTQSSLEPESTPPPPPAQKEAEPDIQTQSKSETPIDFSEIIARTNVELKRLGWTNQQGRDYLVETYGKRSRQLLTDEELLDFLHHLELEPTPD